MAVIHAFEAFAVCVGVICYIGLSIAAMVKFMEWLDARYVPYTPILGWVLGMVLMLAVPASVIVGVSA